MSKSPAEAVSRDSRTSILLDFLKVQMELQTEAKMKNSRPYSVKIKFGGIRYWPKYSFEATLFIGFGPIAAFGRDRRRWRQNTFNTVVG